MVEEPKQATPVAAAHDEPTRLGEHARHARAAWEASKLDRERNDVDGVKDKRVEVLLPHRARRAR